MTCFAFATGSGFGNKFIIGVKFRNQDRSKFPDIHSFIVGLSSLFGLRDNPPLKWKNFTFCGTMNVTPKKNPNFTITSRCPFALGSFFVNMFVFQYKMLYADLRLGL
jgi:hypothetical protein